MTMTDRTPIALGPIETRDETSDTDHAIEVQRSTMWSDHRQTLDSGLTPREAAMQLPFITTDPDRSGESAIDQFRMLADFQDVIDSAADAGLIDDEGAVVFHRQLIAWSRAATTNDVERTPEAIIAAAEARAADIVEDARAAASAEIAQVRSLTIAECDEILAAARAAAARLVDDAMVHALA